MVSSPDPADLLDKLEEVYAERLLPEYEGLMVDQNPDGVVQD